MVKYRTFKDIEDQLPKQRWYSCHKRHSHGGFYGDGNSFYWLNDDYIDFSNKKVYEVRQESYGGQLAEGRDVPANEYLVTHFKVRDYKNAPVDAQQKALKTLEPIIGLDGEDYGQKIVYSRKQFFFFLGRIKKAHKLLNGYDNSMLSTETDREFTAHFVFDEMQYMVYLRENILRLTLVDRFTVLKEIL